VASHLEIHNIFGMQNSRATFEGLKKIDPNSRPFVMTRASYDGGQRYAATWTGDNSSTWNHLKQTTPQLINLGLSGFAMSGADVGGFAGSPQPELLTRWLETAAFHPIDRDHTTVDTNPQEPWENGTPDQVNLRRRYIEERYRLMPYLYTTTEEMSRTGLPIVRPLFLEFPASSVDGEPIDVANINTFLLGPDLLVAESPYPDELDNFTIALPPGGWYDYWTGGRVEGVTAKRANGMKADPLPMVEFHRSPDTLPVLVRAGAIVPEQPLIQSTEEKPLGPLTLRVYPPVEAGTNCVGSVYLDDGVSQDFQKGEFLRESFSCQKTAEGLSVSVAPQAGSFAPWWKQLSVEIYGATKPTTSASATEQGSALPVTAGFDGEHHRITALLPDDGKGLELKLAY
jgi:alpha-glucosidase